MKTISLGVNPEVEKQESMQPLEEHSPDFNQNN